ncbi:MAG TPA: MFS transporter, partial [Rhizomicrobium sp.]|nr:MFS transporter [Rhizomicrobium sp.]
QSKSLSGKQIAAVTAGNALEFYDFLIFGFFAVQIGATFFPAKDPTNSLLLTLVTFAVGFLTRPLGGFVIGPLGDRIGRRPAMLFSFGLMGLSIVGLALTPSYARIGVAAPVLVVIFRLLQGFAIGGEVGPTTAFLMEAAPAEKRGVYVSLQTGTQQAATFFAGVVGVLLTNLMSPADLAAWGWRVAMLLGAAVVPLALVIRRHLPETLAQAKQVDRPKVTSAQIRLALLNLLVIASATITTYVLISINIFATHTLGMSTAQAFGAVVIGGGIGAVFNPIGGSLSDRWGRKPVMIGAYSLLCAVGVPCFMAMSQQRTPAVLYGCVALMASLLALGLPPILTLVSEGLPLRLRSGGVGIIYAVAISLFGGTASFVVTWLTAATGSPLAPAFYMCAALALGVLSMFALRETAPIKTGN